MINHRMSGRRRYEPFAAFTLPRIAPFFNSFLNRYSRRTAQLCAYLNQSIFGFVLNQRKIAPVANLPKFGRVKFLRAALIFEVS